MGFEFGNKSKSGKRPSFMSASAAVEDPLADVEYTDNLEADSAAELDALAEGFRKRRDQEAKRFQNATDSEYWFAVCFKTREEKNKFLAAIKAQRLGDKYLDGHQLARLLGVELDA